MFDRLLELNCVQTVMELFRSCAYKANLYLQGQPR